VFVLSTSLSECVSVLSTSLSKCVSVLRTSLSECVSVLSASLSDSNGRVHGIFVTWHVSYFMQYAVLSLASNKQMKP